MNSGLNKYGIKPFNGEGFSHFIFRLNSVLEEHECLSVVVSDADQNGGKYKKKNVLAKSIIIQSISDKYLDLIKECTEASEIISILKDNFERKSLSEQLMLKRKLLTLKYDEKKPLQDHFMEFESLVRSMKDAGIESDQSEMICNLLLSMPKSYDLVVSSLETMVHCSDQDLTLEFVKSRLLSEETKKKQDSDSSSQLATPSTFHIRTLIKCFQCHETGHIRKNCPKLKRYGNKGNQNYYDNHISKYNSNNEQSGSNNGNYRSGQYNFHRYNNNSNNTANYSDVNKQWREPSSNNFNNSEVTASFHMANRDKEETKEVCFSVGNVNEDYLAKDKLIFCIDSGCTDHIVKDVGYFQTYMKLNEKIFFFKKSYIIYLNIVL